MIHIKTFENFNHNNDIKNGVDVVFKNYPELSKIGTPEEYSIYLDTIFPNSEVKDIVYHRSPNKFDKFDKSNTKEINGNRFYFSPFDTGRYGQFIKYSILDVKKLAKPFNKDFINDVNNKHPEYIKGKSKWFDLPNQIYMNAKKYGYDGVYAYEGTNDDEYSVYEPEQIHILGSKEDINGFKKFVNK